MSCSDPNARCCKFVSQNYPNNKPTHWFHDLDDQYKGRPCLLHKFSATGCDPCPTGSGSVDFGITGSPCHPFSQQRTDRFKDASVQSHHEYQTTMSSLLAWSRTFEPKCWVMEQVKGFDMPFKKGSTDTPLSRTNSFSNRF